MFACCSGLTYVQHYWSRVILAMVSQTFWLSAQYTIELCVALRIILAAMVGYASRGSLPTGNSTVLRTKYPSGVLVSPRKLTRNSVSVSMVFGQSLLLMTGRSVRATYTSFALHISRTERTAFITTFSGTTSLATFSYCRSQYATRLSVFLAQNDTGVNGLATLGPALIPATVPPGRQTLQRLLIT